MIEIKENELYQEIELFVCGEKVGEAEIELKGKMLSRLSIFPPYQNRGYGTEIVKMLNEKYGCNVLWVNADNKKAIHTYEKKRIYDTRADNVFNDKIIRVKFSGGKSK